MNPQPDATRTHLGVGIDTARYAHHASFLREDRQRATSALAFAESAAGYEQLRQRLQHLLQRHPQAHLHVHVDAAGQYADNLLHFLRHLPLPLTVSVGEPKRNRDYHRAFSPKRKADATESLAMARFGVVERPHATPDTPAAFVVLRRIASRLAAQVKQSTRATNQLHQLLAGIFPELDTLVPDIATTWPLRLLQQYPTAKRIAAARLSSIEQIPYLKSDMAKKIHDTAKTSVGSLHGEHIEHLVRHQVTQLQNSLAAETELKELLVQAYDALPASNHLQVETISGIGKFTAAALVATIVSIDRFVSPEKLVGYYGAFPEENSSGLDQFGQPQPSGKRRMCAKGNDLVRALLWNCAKVAIRHNPPVRALYARLVSRSVRGDVALGYCMTKLIHQVFAVWKTGKPFDPHYQQTAQTTLQPAAPPTADTSASHAGVLHASVSQPILPMPSGEAASPNKKAAGRKGQRPSKGQRPKGQAVTAAACTVETTTPAVKPAPLAHPTAPNTTSTPHCNWAEVRAQVTMEQVLRQLGWLDRLRRRGDQLRGPCPVHGAHRSRSRSFSVNLERNIFQCFDADCRASGNILDLWAAVHRVSLPEAAQQLVTAFQLQPAPLTENQRRGTRRRTRETEPVPPGVPS